MMASNHSSDPGGMTPLRIKISPGTHRACLSAYYAQNP